MTARPLAVRGGTDVTGRRLDVLVVAGDVARIGQDVEAPAGASVLDASGLVVAPGLIDLQVNGAGGVDITAEPERLWQVAAQLARHGVTAFCPTVITAPADARRRALQTLRRGRPEGVADGAVPLGLHLEGPMLAPTHKGAHPAQWLAEPSAELVTGWSRSAGVCLVTLAPELPGAIPVIRELVSRGVVVCLGHTAAGTTEVLAAVAAGAAGVTHLFNAMPPLHHREAGPVGVALSGGSALVAGVIADGHHVDRFVLDAAFRALGPRRFLSVSDTTAALGITNGETRLGDSRVLVADGAVRLLDGTLAGSAASLADCVGVLLRATGCSLADAVATATTTPADLIGETRRGRLDPGARGDLVLLSHDADARSLQVASTIVAGTVVHDARSAGVG